MIYTCFVQITYRQIDAEQSGITKTSYIGHYYFVVEYYTIEGNSVRRNLPCIQGGPKTTCRASVAWRDEPKHRNH